MFFVAPFFFIALCWWVERGLPRPARGRRLRGDRRRARRRRPVQRPDQRQRDVGHARADPALDAAGHGTTLDEVGVDRARDRDRASRCCSCSSRRGALVLPLAVLALYAAALWPIEANPHGGIQHASLGALFGGTSSAERDWIDDRARPRRERRGALRLARRWTSSPSGRTSSSTARSGASTTSPTRRPGGLPETPVAGRPAHGAHRRASRRRTCSRRDALQLDEPAVFGDRRQGPGGLPRRPAARRAGA